MQHGGNGNVQRVRLLPAPTEVQCGGTSRSSSRKQKYMSTFWSMLTLCKQMCMEMSCQFSLLKDCSLATLRCREMRDALNPTGVRWRLENISLSRDFVIAGFECRTSFSLNRERHHR